MRLWKATQNQSSISHPLRGHPWATGLAFSPRGDAVVVLITPDSVITEVCRTEPNYATEASRSLVSSRLGPPRWPRRIRMPRYASPWRLSTKHPRARPRSALLSALGERYRRIARRRGTDRAIVAVGRSILVNVIIA